MRSCYGDPNMAYDEREIDLELTPQERAALLRWNFTPEVREQLEALTTSDAVETITVLPFEVRWLESDLNNAILEKGCRDEVVFELADRLAYVDETGDGSLAGW